VLVDLSGWQLGFLALLQIQRDLFLEVSFAFVVFCNDAGAGARWMLWSKDASPGWWICVIPQLRRRATATCALLLAAGLFMDSQSLVGDGALLNLEMVEARRFSQHASRRRWSLAAAADFGECRKPNG
jgi:hypothetical protein